MSPSSRTLWFLLFFLAGCAAASLVRLDHVSVRLLFLFLIPSFFLFILGRRRFPILLAVFFLLGTAYCTGWRYRSSPQFFTSKEIDCQVEVAEPPDNRPDRQLLTVLPQPGGNCQDFAGHAARILLFLDRYPAYRFGDRLRVKGALDPPKVLEDFNYPLYLERSRVYGIIRRPKVSFIRSGSGSLVLAWLYGLREKTESVIALHIPEPEAGFLSGILLGSKRSVPEDVQNALRATGTSHIIAISGANITILLSLLLNLLPVYGKPKQAILASLLSLFMILLTGASASVIRGGIVASLSLWLIAAERRAWPSSLLTVSVFLMAAGNPLLIVADVGFQLSFGAFAGLLYLSQPADRWLRLLPGINRLPPAILASLVETTAATLGTSLISLAQFKQISLLGLLVNPLILWLLPLTTALGLMLIGLGWLGINIVFFNLAAWLPLHTILGIITWFGARPVGIIPTGFPRWAILPLFFVLIVWRQAQESRVALTYKPV